MTVTVSGSFLGGAGFGHLAVLTSQDAGRHHICHRGLDLVLETANDISLALHHCVKAVVGDRSGIILFRGSDVSIHHVGTLEEFRLSRAWHQAGHSYLGVLSSSRSANENEFRKALVPL